MQHGERPSAQEYLLTPSTPSGRTEPPGRISSQRIVLVVDDDDDIRQLVQMTLEFTTDWTVISATCGATAVSMARRHLPDAVLMDMMMPGMDGLAAFAELQADEATCAIPVILVTAKVQVGYARPWDGHAISGVIAKPFDPMALAAQVADLLGWDPLARPGPERPGTSRRSARLVAW
jgi:CheY-like chemotaxis protein